LQGLRRALGRRGLVYVAAIAVLLVMVGGALVSLLEPDLAEGGFWSGVWWAIVTTTTVGYGDISPGTLGGRLIAVALMLVGIGLVATLAASVAAYFVGKEQERPAGADSDLSDIRMRLARIERLLRDRGAGSGDAPNDPAGPR
ncbi:MAG: potassium channel family protein, partial [Actinomycetota bacterium]|nr:potassium channel family protein [Actinomycetota bacterium]